MGARLWSQSMVYPWVVQSSAQLMWSSPVYCTSAQQVTWIRSIAVCMYVSGIPHALLDKSVSCFYFVYIDPLQDPPKMVPPRPDVFVQIPTQVNPNCRHYIKASTGTFSSPNYPNHYRDNITCGWIIQVPPGYNVRLRFLAISLDNR